MISVRHSIALVAFAALALHAQVQRHSYDAPHPWWDIGQNTPLPRSSDYEDPTGHVRILNVDGDLPTKDHPFFVPLGTNGRACVTCHQPANAMSISASMVQQRWVATQGKDPIFAAIDGSNCPDLPQEKDESHSLLLERGLIRIALPWPPKNAAGQAIKPQFRIEQVRDPTGCNSSPVYGLKSPQPMISVYRRPRIAANLPYVARSDGATLMADGREPSLRSQAVTAILVHEQAKSAPGDAVMKQIVDFERQVFTAQNWDTRGGLLSEKDGPSLLGAENVAHGVGGSGSLETANVSLQSFDAWRNPGGARLAALQRSFRESAVRGFDLFFRREFQMSAGGTGTCATCHQPGMSRSVDVGTTNSPTAKESDELPLFKITCDNGRVSYTQDPGRALITGACADVGAILMQQFRGLAARAPYFVNGSATDLRELVGFYDRRFKIGLTEQQKQDLANFLSIL